MPVGHTKHVGLMLGLQGKATGAPPCSRFSIL